MRSGELDHGRDRRLARRHELLDWADRFADVPRTPPVRTGRTAGQCFHLPWVQEHGSVSEVVSWLHLTADEAAAGAILLAVLTGQNPTVILKVASVHHRADGYAGAAGTAIVGLNKRRRGPRAHMSLALSEIPDWISIPDDPDDVTARDMLHTPFGVYLLLHELTARSRELAGGNRLLVGFSDRGGKGAGGGVRWIGEADFRIRRWATLHGITADKPDAGGNPVPLRLTLGLIRLTYLELHQKPVAHTEQTLASDYLGRNRGNLAEYQKVVAVTLKDEVAKARARGAMTLLTEDDLRHAQESPEAAAHTAANLTAPSGAPRDGHALPWRQRWQPATRCRLDLEAGINVYAWVVDGLRVSELAERAGVTPSTVRFYERAGLLSPARRAANGYRVFDESALAELAFVSRAKGIGMSLEDIAGLVAAWPAGECRSLQARLRGFLAARIGQVREQVAELGSFEAQLQAVLGRLSARDPGPEQCGKGCGCETDLDLAPAIAGPGPGLRGWAPGRDAEGSRAGQWRAVAAAAVSAERAGGTVRLVLPASPDTISAVAALCAAETASCPQARFVLEVTAGQVMLTVHAAGIPGLLGMLVPPGVPGRP